MSPANSSPMKTIRATQRKRMSRAVSRTSVGIERAQLRGVVGPAERRERPQRAREPRVQHVRVALPARPVRRVHADVGLVAAVVDRQPVAPPQLARDAPGPDVLQPVQVAPPLALGVDPDPALGDRGVRRRGQLLHLHEPLERDQRLDPLARALRVRHLVRVRLGAVDPSLLAQRGDDRLARLERRQAGEAPGRLGHPAVLADHRSARRARACGRSRSRSGRGRA